jgi:hypothetical protein
MSDKIVLATGNDERGGRACYFPAVSDRGCHIGALALDISQQHGPLRPTHALVSPRQKTDEAELSVFGT